MISVSNLCKGFGGQILFVDASFQINAGEKVGLVGPNGAGKSTVFRLLVGEEQPDDGVIEKPKRLTIGYFRQDVGDWRGQSILQATVSGAGELADLAAEMAELTVKLEHPDDDFEKVMERFGEVQARYQELGGYELESKAQAILLGLGFSIEQFGEDVSTLSGGWKMRVALGRILLSMPDLLLLDEPTNYLDLESILWLEVFLRDYQGAVVMTCHDRDIMNRVAKKILEIDGGEVTTYSGNYDFYDKMRAEDALRKEAAYARQQAMLAKESRFVERFKTHAAKAAQVQSRIKKLDKIEKIEPPKRFVEKVFDFRAPVRSGEDVVKVAHVSKGFGERNVHKDVSFIVRRKERLAIMGENGAGKSTLLKMMAGVLSPDDGNCELGAQVSLGYYAQNTMDGLVGDQTVMEELQHHAPTANLGTLRNLAGAFGFHDDDVEKPIRILSGGEKARVALAKILYSTPNLLILDEPTNHLDIATKRQLVRSLASYEGTLIFVSHDRQFLHALASRVLEVSKGQPARFYNGDYAEYVQSTGREGPGMRLIS